MAIARSMTIVYGLLSWLICDVGSLSFEVSEYELNRVVFTGEQNIKMTCNASEFESPKIVIRHGGMIVRQQNNSSFVLDKRGNILELTITRVRPSHNGTYGCMVTSESRITEVGELPLNVVGRYRGGYWGRDCLQNETTLIKMVGGYFTLYCYYIWVDGSNYNTWKVTHNLVSETLTGMLNATQIGIKGVIILHVGPIGHSDHANTYTCSHPLSQESGSSSCSIGPITVQPRSQTDTPIAPTSPPLRTTRGANNSASPTSLVDPHGSTKLSSELSTPSHDLSTTGTITPVPNQTLLSGSIETSSSSPISPETRSSESSGSSDTLSGISLVVIASSVAAIVVIGAAIVSFVSLAIWCHKRGKSDNDSPEPAGNLGYDLTANPVYESGDPGGAAKVLPTSPGVVGGSEDVETTSFHTFDKESRELAALAGHLGYDLTDNPVYESGDCDAPQRVIPSAPPAVVGEFKDVKTDQEPAVGYDLTDNPVYESSDVAEAL